jgi:hypothetical protein
VLNFEKKTGLTGIEPSKTGIEPTEMVGKMLGDS